jgi:hypothetical protein
VLLRAPWRRNSPGVWLGWLGHEIVSSILS